jgi:hypothetical protein
MVNVLNTGSLGGDFGGDDDFVQELLSDQNATGDFRDFVLAQRRLQEWRDAGPHPDGKILQTILNRPDATAAFLRRLRGYVDEWLNTGRHRDGGESPKDRDVRLTRFARLVAEGYIRERPPLVAWGREPALFLQPLQLLVDPSFEMYLGHLEQQTARVFPK